MRIKHILIPGAFILNLFNLYAQQSEPCDGLYSDHSLKKTYQHDIDKINVSSTVFSMDFNVEKAKVETLTTWAKSEGYLVTQRPRAICKPEDEISKAGLTTVTIIQNLIHPTFDYFKTRCKNVVNKVTELEITGCLGFNMKPNYLYENEPCLAIYQDSVFTKFYNSTLKNKITSSDTIRFSFTVKKAEAQKLKEWAAANQFNTYPDIELYSGVPDEEERVLIIFNKQLQEPLFDFYAGTIKKVGKMKDELGVGCGDYYVSY